MRGSQVLPTRVLVTNNTQKTLQSLSLFSRWESVTGVWCGSNEDSPSGRNDMIGPGFILMGFTLPPSLGPSVSAPRHTAL